MSFGYCHVYLPSYSGSEADGSFDGAVFPSGLIIAEVKKAVLNSWARSFYSVVQEDGSDRSDDYVDWLMTAVWAEEKKKRVALIEEIESDLG